MRSFSGLSSPFKIRYSRRQVLRLALLGMAGGLAACSKGRGPDIYTMATNPTPQSTKTPNPTPTATTSPLPSPTPTLEATSNPFPMPTAIDFYPTTPIVIDAHQDIAWNAFEYRRDPVQSAVASRKDEAGTRTERDTGLRTTGLAEYIAGRVALIFTTLFILPGQYHTQNYKTSYQTPGEAESLAQDELAYYFDLGKREGHFRVVMTKSDLAEVLSSWQDGQPAEQRQTGLVILLEGADPIVSPDDVAGWFQMGLRIISPAWETTRYAASNLDEGTFSVDGFRLLKNMETSNMILDLAHIAEKAFFDALDVYQAPVIASHSNPRKFTNNRYGLSTDMIRRLAEKGGVEGIMPINSQLQGGWTHDEPRLSLSKVAEAIDYHVQLVGDTLHVAIGSDFDGGFGLESLPAEMDTIQDMLKLVPFLSTRGYQPLDIRNIFYGNWLRILNQGLL